MADKHITVLDTDLGTDDACALLLLRDLPKKADYIVTAFGNTTLESACKNAVILKKYLGLNAILARGVASKSDVPCDEENSFHGADGLGGIQEAMLKSLAVTGAELDDILSFDDFAEEIKQADKITYITIGTLSNLAVLIKDKTFCAKLQKVYIMGGGIEEFNSPNNTEFNFYKDPESVKAILSSGLDMTLFTLDVTNHHFLLSSQIDELEKTGKYPEYIHFLRKDYSSNVKFNGRGAAVLHDTLPVIFNSYPELFTTEQVKIISDEYGRTYKNEFGNKVTVCRSFEKGKLFEFIKSAFEN